SRFLGGRTGSGLQTSSGGRRACFGVIDNVPSSLGKLSDLTARSEKATSARRGALWVTVDGVGGVWWSRRMAGMTLHGWRDVPGTLLSLGGRQGAGGDPGPLPRGARRAPGRAP